MIPNTIPNDDRDATEDTTQNFSNTEKHDPDSTTKATNFQFNPFDTTAQNQTNIGSDLPNQLTFDTNQYSSIKKSASAIDKGKVHTVSSHDISLPQKKKSTPDINNQRNQNDLALEDQEGEY